MIRHVVLVRFRADLFEAEIGAVLAELAALRTVLPGMRAFAAGRNVSVEPLSCGYTHAFTCDFADAAARDAYLVHPAHQAAGARLVSAAEGGVDGLIVVDIEAE